MSDFIHDITQRRTEAYVDRINGSRSITSTNISVQYHQKIEGKVRDIYVCKDFVILYATDRQSAFDRQLTSVPFKGIFDKLYDYW